MERPETAERRKRQENAIAAIDPALVESLHGRNDPDKLYEQGILGLGWHTPKLPGLGDVDWGGFFAALTDTGYRGPVCIEVEDRAYEASLADRQRALRQSRDFLKQFMAW